MAGMYIELLNALCFTRPCSSYTDIQLVEALADFVGIFFNYTGTVTCNDINASANNATEQDGLPKHILF